MPISIGSAAITWVVMRLKPIAATNHRIMVPPGFLLDLTADEGRFGLKHDRIVPACNPQFWQAASTIGSRACSSLQARGVPPQMIAHESGDEVVAVVVTGLTAQGERNVGF